MSDKIGDRSRRRYTLGPPRKSGGHGEPEIVRAVYKGFCDAKEASAAQLAQGMTFNNMAIMVPWLTRLLQADRELLGADWWPYGMATNRAAIDAVLRYHHEQGLTSRRLSAEEVFVPGLLDS